MKSIKRNANMHRGRHVIRYYSKKNGCVLKLEGFLELWLACKLNNDMSVQCFASQPEEIVLEIDGRKRRFTPDFLVNYTDGTSEYIEIHHEQFTDAEYEQKVQEFSRYTRKTNGWAIKLICSGDVNETELVNFQLIADCKSQELSFDISYITFPESISFGELIKFIEKLSSDPIPDAYYLLALGVYTFDTNSFLTIDTPLSRRVLP